MKQRLRIILVLVILLGVGGALVAGFVAAKSERTADADSEEQIQGPARVMQQNGRTVLSFDAQAQRENGITAANLRAENWREETQATGIVLQLQPLLDLKTSYNTARMDIAKAQAAALASDAEYKRLSELNQGSNNVSEKAIETARAGSESDQATLANAQQSLAVLKDSTELKWGAAVANWLENGSPQLSALVAQREFLVQVTATGGGSFTPHASGIVQLPGGTHAEAHLLSSLPQLDPRLQAPSFLYTVSAHPGLVPGMNLAVALPTGALRKGVIVPDSAVVWWQGKAWCYVEAPAGKFTRFEVPTGSPAPGGWFVSEGITPGTQVVTKGAQTLLSEEFHSAIQMDED
jgi:hypothetical protein